MTPMAGSKRTDQVQTLFAHIAKRYDRMNRLLSWGQDTIWRQRVVVLTHLPDGGKLLDVGTGTGDLILEALRSSSLSLAVGCDFTQEMMRLGKTRKGGERVGWVHADAHDLPFPDASFDAVTSGYLLRNVANIRQVLTEQYRVLKPGGRAVCLDTTPPSSDWFHWPVRFYLHTVIPLLGRFFAGETDAYAYLSESTVHFIHAEELANCMRSAGFRPCNSNVSCSEP
jgi:demethylmenaquinone methyltransferase/2-methoxy-6-polyprenyl-1,4-benzoquinol methylase